MNILYEIWHQQGGRPTTIFKDEEEALEYAAATAGEVREINLDSHPAGKDEVFLRWIAAELTLHPLWAYRQAQAKVDELRPRLPELLRAAQAAEVPIAEIARAAGISRPTVYSLLDQSGFGH